MQYYVKNKNITTRNIIPTLEIEQSFEVLMKLMQSYKYFKWSKNTKARLVGP
jgi:hypothetical protein